MEGEHVSVIVETRESTRTSEGGPTSLAAALREVAVKRDADLIRFRTCCADPRASK
jgi:hypothetical protein